MPWPTNVTLAVDIGFGSGPFAASPIFTDIIADMQEMSINRGRTTVRSDFDAGTITLTLDNMNGNYDPNNTTSPHSPDIKIGTPIRITATHNAIPYVIFRGHLARVTLLYPDTTYARAVWEGTDNLALINLAQLTAQVYSEESTDTRLANILDDISWQAAARDIDSGVTDVAAITHSGTAWSLLTAAVEAEQGHFFVAADGDATFKNRVALSGLSSQATYGPGGGELRFQTIDPLFDDDLLTNEAEVTGATGAAQTASDATSITDHGPHGSSISSSSILNANAALNVAQWVVGRNKDVATRIVRFSVDPQRDPVNQWPELLGRELLELVTVKLDPPGADSLNQLVAVEHINHEVTTSDWITTFGCHPLATFDSQTYWILDTSQLDTGTRLA